MVFAKPSGIPGTRISLVNERERLFRHPLIYTPVPDIKSANNRQHYIWPGAPANHRDALLFAAVQPVSAEGHFTVGLQIFAKKLPGRPSRFLTGTRVPVQKLA